MKNQKTTKKEIMRNYKKVIQLGYCEAQFLLRFKNRKNYTSGTYGWNADVYQIDFDTAIVTGYRPFGNVRPDYDLVKKYELEACEIVCSDLDFEVMEEKVNELLERFIEEV